ncbi:expressed unknown protein [Seminavis robusta]|uniref:Uncharacterized protein n=1 Tax=Seminavis robusta TaxID=568900 RepID=A0A9N8HMK1_9STRA|nr:expressed unknown protein [Seminavis robusta]|eukprot:Sro1007_g230480.1 n/a (326) ;mRNA; f:37952-38929
MMGSKQMSTVWLVALALSSASAFQPLVSPTQRRHQGLQQPVHPGSLSRTTRAVWSRQPSLFQASPVQDDEDDRAAASSETKQKTRLSRFRQRVSKFLKKKLVVAVFVGSSIAGIWTPRPAEASAPVMAVPKAEQRDPATDALLNHDRKMVVKQQQELQEMNKRAREIEASEGTAARSKFEKEYKAQKEKEAQDRIDAVTQLKRDLLDQGMDPFTTIEGQRQVILAEKGVDLGKVPGTMMYLQKQLEGGKKIEKSLLYKQAPNRRVVKAMVEDMKNKGQDPLAYFDDHQEQTQTIMAMTPVAAAQLAQKYQANLEQYDKSMCQGEK